MTKQEAITILTASDYFWLRPSENEAEALNMAIEALQSERPGIIRCEKCRYDKDCEIQYSAQE